ncbi:hypothetical protein JCM15519_25920 [Fundidesulfovibrio butyratiphilus]
MPRPFSPTANPNPTWEARYAHMFPPTIRKRGEEYFRLGRVSLEKANPRTIAATVEGSEEYLVDLADDGRSGRGARASCECSHFMSGHLCKHLWAAILAADAELKARFPAQHAPGKTGSPWRELLFPAVSNQNKETASKTSSGAYVLRYELSISRGRVALSALRQAVLKNGGLGKQVAPASAQVLDDENLSETDRSILEAMVVLTARSSPRYGRWNAPAQPSPLEDCRLDTRALTRTLPLLAASGRCRTFFDGRIIADPLEAGEPFEGRLEFSLVKACLAKGRPDLEYIPHVRLGDESVPCSRIPVFLDAKPLHCIVEGRLHSLPGPDLQWVQRIRDSQHKVRVPKTDVKAVFQLAQDGQAFGLELPEALGPRALTAVQPRPCLEIEALEGGHEARLWLDYAGSEIPFEDTRPSLLDMEAWTRVDRQPEVERQFDKRLLGTGFAKQEGGRYLLEASAWHMLAALAPLVEEGWTVRSRAGKPLVAGAVSPIRVTSGVDWFELEGAMAFGDVIVPLPTAVRAFLRGEKTLDLPDGTTGVLPEDWLSLHAPGLSLAGEERTGNAGLRFHAAHAPLLDELFEDRAVSLERDFAQRLQRMKDFSGVTLPAPPVGLQGALRPYQRESLGWFDFLKTFAFGGILADDMGLGKTVQVLAWLMLEKERGQSGPSLVVAPTSLVFNWRAEATRFAPDLRVLVHAGLDRASRVKTFEEHDLVLTTYGLLRRDAPVLQKTRWKWLILDESQAIKNPDSQTARAARMLQADHRLCATGTPVENRLDELWSQMHFLNRGMLGSRSGFDDRFAKPVSQGDQAAKDLLQRLVRPFVLRRTKEGVATDLPEKQESLVRCEMPKEQRAVYARLREHYRCEILRAVDEVGLGRSKIKVLEGLLRLRQAACHPGLVGAEAAGSGKLEELVRLLREVVEGGHKALVFSQFTRFLTLIRKRLEAEGIAYEYLDGRTPAKAREQRVAAFQDSSGPPVFCISLKAGGTGLNLTAADYVFLMDPWWNPAVESQAVDRAHRIGQEKKVFAYRLVSDDTIDEKVLALQKEKRELAAILEEGATSMIGALTRENLELLLS